MTLAPPAPYNWTAGYDPQPADLNTYIRDTFKFLSNKMVFRAWQSSVQSIANATVAPLHLDTIVEDTYSGWTGSPSWIWKPPYDGWYQVSGAYMSAGVTSIQMNCCLGVNGVWTYQESAQGSSLTGPGVSCLQEVFLRASTDYVQVGGIQYSGAAQNTYSAGLNHASYTEILWVSK
jgi:hypothetical protein